MNLQDVKSNLQRELNDINELLAKQDFLKNNLLNVGLNTTNDEEFCNSIADYIQNDEKKDHIKTLVIIASQIKQYLKNSGTIKSDPFGKSCVLLCKDCCIVDNETDCVYKLDI